jgi:glycosyltransferase involved in cell wall biosynthesis
VHIAYLYSRYPVISQTFCDTEMIALERLGFSLEIGSIYPPHTSSRHEHSIRLQAPIYYGPPQPVMRAWELIARKNDRWPADLIERHERQYGSDAKAALRARNALYFADLFARHAIDYFHVHFTNRAAHTALFVKAISGIPFGVTAHGQDFMVDLGSEELLREICDEAEFVAAETDYSCGLLKQRCPGAAGKIHRVYNGMDLTNFPRIARAGEPTQTVRILSVGRLVAFKGFDQLIEACAQLKRRKIAFQCEIVGDGPLREQLRAHIQQLALSDCVVLMGSLPQEQVFERLRSCDIFVLACVEAGGASDVFPTVILEAMAAGRPVVSSAIAGVPESVVNGVTGLLVPPSDVTALSNALQQLAADAELRNQFGAAGRARIEEAFQVETTVAPLRILIERSAAGGPRKVAPLSNRRDDSAASIAYLIDIWPDEQLPDLVSELRALRRADVPVVGYVCQVAETAKVADDDELFATHLEFLPDAIVIEADWQQHRGLARQLEDERAKAPYRLPAALFMRQARFAITLMKMMERRRIRHLHATSSRSLICGLLLSKILRLPLTASIEARTTLPKQTILGLLGDCVGGRISDRNLRSGLDGSFVFDPTNSPRWMPSLARSITRLSGIDLTAHEQFWQQWAKQLAAFPARIP